MLFLHQIMTIATFPYSNSLEFDLLRFWSYSQSAMILSLLEDVFVVTLIYLNLTNAREQLQHLSSISKTFSQSITLNIIQFIVLSILCLDQVYSLTRYRYQLHPLTKTIQ